MLGGSYVAWFSGISLTFFVQYICKEGNTSKMTDFDIFPLLECKSRIVDLMVNGKMAALSANLVLKNV